VQVEPALAVAATAITGILAGASLDQSIKQLPARHRIGVVAYSAYSRAADLRNGVWWYATLGIVAAFLSLAAGILAFNLSLESSVRDAGLTVATFAILHTVATTQAAPVLFRQETIDGSATTLADLFDRFERWQSIRAALQTINFAALLWLLIELFGHGA
jgi:hypothetical protein